MSMNSSNHTNEPPSLKVITNKEVEHAARRLREFIRSQGIENTTIGQIHAAVIDLLPSDINLHAPLKDLTSRPGFRQLAGLELSARSLAIKHSLLAEMHTIYTTGILEVMSTFLDEIATSGTGSERAEDGLGPAKTSSSENTCVMKPDAKGSARKGEIDAVTDIYLSKKEASSGHQLQLRKPNNESYLISLPKGLRNGQLVRVRGLGRILNNKAGDLYLRINIERIDSSQGAWWGDHLQLLRQRGNINYGP